MAERRLDRYQIVGKIGSGGMATVYKALDPRGGVNRMVAVKVLRPQFASNDQLRDRFMHEARIAANLEHLHILPIYDYGKYRSALFIVMRLMEHGSLKELLKNEGVLPTTRAAAITRQIADALSYAQSKGVTHRDLKPANVLLDDVGNTYLSDFGLAQLAEDSMQLTGNSYIGTPAYSSPEQCKGDKVTHATDIYSLGVILFEMLCGQVPFTGTTMFAVLNKHIGTPVPDMRRFNPRLTEPIVMVVNRALAKAPGARYPTARALADDLERAVGAGSPAVIGGEPDPTLILPRLSSGEIPVASVTQPQPASTPPTPPSVPLGPPVRQLTGHTGPINALAWSNGLKIASASHDHTVRIWDVATGTVLIVLAGHTERVSTVAWSPDGSYIASGGQDGSVRIWRASDGKELGTMGPWGWIWSVAWSPDGTRLAVGSGDERVRICHLRGEHRRQVTVLEGHRWDVLSVAWNSAGSMLATASYDNTVRIWQLEGPKGSGITTLEHMRQTIYSVAWQPGQSGRLAGGAKDGTVYLWRVRENSAAQLTPLEAHSEAVRAVAWAPSGSLLASAGDDRTVSVWDADSRARLAVFEGHTQEVNAAAWGPQPPGQPAWLASGSKDGTIRLWTVP
ncbi:MAG: serine/threonine protein kinase [Anaerolineae bacterium]|nr:serine/threonine protein kinase [Anaerolineae bacterium]